MDLVENGGDVPCQFRADDVSVISVPEVHVLEGVIGLQKLKMIAMVSMASKHGVCTVRTSLSGSLIDKTSSVAFLTSSISSGLDGTTTHRLKLANLNRPGLA